MKKWITILAFLITASGIWGHCQVPCGIFNDSARIQQINEHITTIEKAMIQIEKIGSKNLNQTTRWITTKETHANDLNTLLHDYFLTQRLKPVSSSASDREQSEYYQKLKVIHHMTVATMKSKQSTDLAHTIALKALNKRLHKLFLH